MITLLAKKGRTGLTSVSFLLGPKVMEVINDLGVLHVTYPGTKKPKTETFVVRSKKREDVLKRAVDIGGVEMVIQEKAKKEEEKVELIKEKVAAPQVRKQGQRG